MCDTGPVNHHGLTPDGVIRRADQHYDQSLWYAWGMADSGAVPGLTLDHGWQFASERRQAALAFYSGQTGWMTSTLHAWQAFLAAHDLHPMQATA